MEADGIPVELFQILKDDVVKVPDKLKGIGRGSGKTGQRNAAVASHPAYAGEVAEIPNTPKNK